MNLLFIGIDGLGVDQFEEIWLPSLPEGIAWGECRAPIAMTGPSWTSLLTGLPAEEHGVTDLFGLPRNGSKGFTHLDGRYLFDRLEGSSGVLNMPTAYPPRAKSGSWMVSGYPYKPSTAPNDLLCGVDYIGDYASVVMRNRRRQNKDWQWAHEYDVVQALTLLGMVEQLHLDAAITLPVVENLFVFMMYYDRVGHVMQQLSKEAWRPSAAKYCLDWTLDLIKHKPAGIVVVCSDHGWDTGSHDERGCWAMWPCGTSGRKDIVNHELRSVIETQLNQIDPDVWNRLSALGYV